MDGLQEILYTLRQNKLRTLLTAFGVFWGIFMLILLLGAGKGMQNGVYDGFGSDVMDFIVVYTGATSVAHKGMGVGRFIQLTQEDIQAIKEKVPGIRFIASENQMGGATIKFKNKVGIFSVHGIPDEYFEIKASVPFDIGRKLNSFDQQQIRKICILGRAVAERIFHKEDDPIGKEVQVNGVISVRHAAHDDRGLHDRPHHRSVSE
jgi:putative ABC transport system permease protein